MTLRFLGPLVAASLFVGCASSSTSHSHFPSPARLKAIAEAPTPPPAEGTGIMVPEFVLEGPFSTPEMRASHPTANMFTAAVVAAAGRSGLDTDDGMACVARNLGRFWLTHRSYPAPAIREFISARCGAETENLQLQTVYGEAPAEMSDAEVVDAWRASITEMASAPAAGAIGAWFGRARGQAVFVRVVGVRRARRTALEAAPGGVVVTGEILSGATEINAVVTHGPFGYASCEPLPGVVSPRFRFRCPLRPTDPYARVDVSILPPGRRLGITVLGMLVPGQGELPDRWRDEMRISAHPVDSVDALEQATLDIVNTIRERAGLEPLRIEASESLTARRLSRRFFSIAGSEVEVAEEIALGMMAGWDVEAKVSSAGFFSRFVDHTQDASVLASALLVRPAARTVLLDPLATRVALGPLLTPTPSLGVVASTYRTLEGTGRDRIEAAYAAIRRSRARADKPPLDRLASLEGVVQEAADAVSSGRKTPQQALDSALESASRSLGTGTQGVLLTTSSFEDYVPPPEMLAGFTSQVAVGVGVHAPLEQPWAQWIVLIVGTDRPMRAETLEGAGVKGRMLATTAPRRRRPAWPPRCREGFRERNGERPE